MSLIDLGACESGLPSRQSLQYPGHWHHLNNAGSSKKQCPDAGSLATPILMTTTHVNMSAGTRIKNLKCSPSSVPANRLMNTGKTWRFSFVAPLAHCSHSWVTAQGHRRASDRANPDPLIRNQLLRDYDSGSPD